MKQLILDIGLEDGGKGVYYPSEWLCESLPHEKIESAVRSLLREVYPNWSVCTIKVLHFDKCGRNYKNEFFKITKNKHWLEKKD